MNKIQLTTATISVLLVKFFSFWMPFFLLYLALAYFVYKYAVGSDDMDFLEKCFIGFAVFLCWWIILLIEYDEIRDNAEIDDIHLPFFRNPFYKIHEN